MLFKDYFEKPIIEEIHLNNCPMFQHLCCLGDHLEKPIVEEIYLNTYPFGVPFSQMPPFALVFDRIIRGHKFAAPSKHPPGP